MKRVSLNFFAVLFFCAFLCPAQQLQVALVNVGFTNVGVSLDLKVVGQYAYLANGFNGLRICDISNPTNPISVGQISSLGYPHRVTVSGSRVYLVSDSGLNIYDVSNPGNPVDLGSAALSGFPNSVVVSNNYAYLGGPGLCVFDVSDPANPVQVGQASNGNRYQMVLAGNYIYATAPNSGSTLYVYDVSSPASPSNIFSSAGSYVFGIAVSGHYLFAASQLFISAPGQYRSGLLTFDISNPTNPIYLASNDDSIGANARVEVSGNFAYLVDSLNGLRIYDISNPTNLIKVGYINDFGSPYSVAVAHNHAYVSGADGLVVYAIVPQLSVSASGTNTLLFSWPAPAIFALQQNPDLMTTNWITLTNQPTSIGAHDQIVLPRPISNAFYRLISQ